MKKIILLSLMMVLGFVCVVRGQVPLIVNPYIGSDTLCDNSITIDGHSNRWYFVLNTHLSEDTSMLGDSILYTSGNVSGYIKIISLYQFNMLNKNNNLLNFDSGVIYAKGGDSVLTIYNVYVGGLYTVYGVYDISSASPTLPFCTESCVQLDGDSINEDSSFNTFCKNSPITIKNTTDTTLYFSNGDTVKSNSDFTLKNLSEGINNIEYGIGNTNYTDTIKFYGIDCLIDEADTLFKSVINNKNCVDGDSILNFKFNFTNNQNSDTDYYFNYSKFKWVIKDSIGKTVDSLITTVDSISLTSLSELKGKDTLYCTAMSEYFDTTVSISFTVNPYPTLNISLQDTSINLGDSVQLIANSNGSVIWSPSTGLSCTNCSNPVADPSTTITYTATSTERTCEVSDTVTITVITTGINQQSVKNNNSSIYPNPSPGQFTIQLNDNKNNYTVEIYNVLGEKIYYSVLNNTHSNIDLSSHPAGVYFVYLKSKEDVNVEKVLITK